MRHVAVVLILEILRRLRWSPRLYELGTLQPTRCWRHAYRADIGDRDVATGEEPLPLKPVAGDAGCKQYLPRAIASLSLVPETADETLGIPPLVLLQQLQAKDPFVQRKQYERMPTSGAGDAVWSISAGDQLL